ncbi:hypothetical protein HYQ21_gp229 [Acinetobacter phage vB_AbaM_Apostate]|uniref:Uncharacterized protein n=1 Tax=Acinetobacter phage vB_AbaM_Apostate TaxID=2686308 RepID=A0A6B9J515_9CAUD|nr:hypothetical protein HYQ21_gp229 [Acinetobacter phage vB_AbaM_Apostate]QGZ15745.1 hypothetical protein Apostate_156 [Acinetobacter phage vB_AbaM_Apostate]
MAKIVPATTKLSTIMEGDNVSFTFSAELAATEKLVSLKIIQHDFPSYISINGATFSGRFTDLFKLPLNSLKYRKGLEYGQATTFAELPPKGTAVIYSFTTPNVMLKDFNLTVQLTYTEEANPTTELNITNSYIQPVQGNWDTFKHQFLDYVR